MNFLVVLFILCVVLHMALGASVPVFVMLPLTTVASSMTINNYDQLKSRFQTLKNAGVKGVMVDCWFGLVEKVEKSYNFSPYRDLAQMARDTGLNMQFVMSFHRCGGNVGDDCNIPLPSWVTGNSDQEIWYKDQQGNKDTEYISLFADDKPVIGSMKRTPLQVYSDFMSAFRSNLLDYIGTTVTEVQVGTGPCGELRYPSYQLDKWSFCGIGEFQSYSTYALDALSSAAQSAGHSEWGHSPTNAGSYNSHPSDTSFFSDNGSSDNYKSSYGQFYLKWYSDTLITHGDKIMKAANTVFGSSLSLSMKVAGIHWWYNHASHAAELTAGYYNTAGVDGYGNIAKMLSAHNATFDFTCLEMKDSEQPSSCSCGPYELVQQTKAAAIAKNVKYSGENALQRYDTTAYSTIKSQASSQSHTIDNFTYLRMTDDLFSGTNWNYFVQFVNDMKYL